MDQFFVDYLERLQTLDKDFVASFDGLPAEALDWIPGEEMNSFVILVVHTTAAARYWIGDVPLGEPSGRQRSEEFKAQGLSSDELKARFATLETYVAGALERLNVADLGKTIRYNHPMNGAQETTIGSALLHALDHTALHLGHAQITRQLWEQRH